MAYQLLATAIALVHFGFILFVIIGGVLLLRWPRLMWLHLPAVVWGALIEFAGLWCPLTRWENYCLRAAGKAGYSEGFVAHYLFAVIYPAGLTRPMEMAIGTVVVLVNAAIYVRVLK